MHTQRVCAYVFDGCGFHIFPISRFNFRVRWRNHEIFPLENNLLYGINKIEEHSFKSVNEYRHCQPNDVRLVHLRPVFC